MKQRNIPCPKCSAMFWTERSRDTHLEEVDHNVPEKVFTKVNVRKDLIEKIKIKALVENRSITNYIENLILKDLNV